jgi:SAM-dependent methyltransferase
VPSPAEASAEAAQSSESRRAHWEDVYSGRSSDELGWYQATPRMSLELVTAAANQAAGNATAILDAGGGTSQLGLRLAAAGYTDVTVADISPTALKTSGARLGSQYLTWVDADLLTWQPTRTFQVWHDRAVFHFLTSPQDRAAYLATVRTALRDGGTVILGTFAAGGPEQCSGLPVARYGPADLAAELTAAFGAEVEVAGQRSDQHRTPAGAVQPFTWVTARLAPRH